jgi:hypothetical protein
MIKPTEPIPASRGCDAAHRDRNLSTHLTHACTRNLQRFSRLRREYAGTAIWQIIGFARFPASAPRPLGEAML